jgi:hypothetical protein
METNLEAFLELMRACREAMTRQMSEVKPFGVCYSGMLTVVAAIDAVETLLGRPEHYWDRQHTAARKPDR